MISREQWQRFLDQPAVEWTIFALGVVLMLLSPVGGVLPGPLGILMFGLGLAMVLKTSMWAKRRYVRFKRWQPRVGKWTDWGLRRESAKRRDAVRKQAEPAPLIGSEDGGNIGQAPASPPGGAPLDVPEDPWPERKAPAG